MRREPSFGLCAGSHSDDISEGPLPWRSPRQLGINSTSITAPTYAREAKGFSISLRVFGKLADVAVLSDDPFVTSPASLRDIAVELTIMGGKITFERQR